MWHTCSNNSSFVPPGQHHWSATTSNSIVYNMMFKKAEFNNLSVAARLSCMAWSYKRSDIQYTWTYTSNCSTYPSPTPAEQQSAASYAASDTHLHTITVTDTQHWDRCRQLIAVLRGLGFTKWHHRLSMWVINETNNNCQERHKYMR